MNPLPLSFYQNSTKKVARELLGKRLFHLKNSKLTSGIIIETEAYLGFKDPAAHTFQGHRTQRVESMYLPGGHSYVYLIYGLHYCFNVVTQNTKRPEAVLVRALWPVDGQEIMVQRRKMSPVKHLCSGPGKLCQAMGIDRNCDGLSLMGPEIWVAEDIQYSKIKKHIQRGPRIGIDYAGEAKAWPLRYFIDPDIFRPNA